MRNEELVNGLKYARAHLRYTNCFHFAEEVGEAIKRLTIYDRPPTVEEVGDDEECLYKEDGVWEDSVWGQETGKYIRENWWDGECWMYLPKENGQ